MSMSFTIELSDKDLAHFNEAIAKAKAAAAGKSDAEVTGAARQLLVNAANLTLPDFIASRPETNWTP